MEPTHHESRHLSVFVDRPADEVYAYASDPVHLPDWAPGIANSIERVGDRWVVQSPMGPVDVAFAPRNDFGVLDHDVTVESGQTFHNPMRVLPDGEGCEVVFTLRRQPGMSDAEFDRDADAVAADLGALKRIVEGT